ncbi:MAG: M23 family metallopeptidase, partial [Thaumarchaeota archaeon]|nr:M23 family metallopeptidase [Nitrososphaerota archaeon]
MEKVLQAILLLALLFVFGCTTGEQLATDTSAEGHADVQTSADAEAATETVKEDSGHPEEDEKMPSRREEFKVGLLSPRGCEGSGSFMLGASPLALEDIEKIRPMGGLSSVHITPTDHQYWDTVGSDVFKEDTTNLDRFKVFAPADGFIVDIEQHTDYRVVIEHSCTFYTIFIHVDKLSDKIMAAAGLKEGQVGKHAWPRVPVKEGEVIGTIG